LPSLVKGGDANSKLLFHCIMSSRRLSNAVISINVNGVKAEGVNNIRESVFQHFQHHFASFEPRLGISNFPFKSLTAMKGVELNQTCSVGL
jgi:hypothetical protein